MSSSSSSFASSSSRFPPPLLPLLLLLFTLFSGTARAAPLEDRIVDLPGWGPPPTPQYSGYLDASEGCDAAKNGPVCKIHYWLAMADADDADDEADDDSVDAKPTVLWLNGGPGSSSLLGWVQEVGPLLLNATGGLMENPWAWTKAGVNLMAIEAPMGVGFSYCSNQIDRGRPCVNTDTNTAEASRAALVDFFSRKFPELRDAPFYVSGESYAGVYIPTLARELLTHPDAKKHVPLKGILVGDPCTDNDAQRDSMDPLWYSRKYGLMDEEVYDVLVSDECSGYASKALLRTMTRRRRGAGGGGGGSDARNPEEPLVEGGTHSSRSHRSVGKRWSSHVAAAELNQELIGIEDLDERRLRAEDLYRERVLGVVGVTVDGGEPDGRESGRGDRRLRAAASVASDGSDGDGDDDHRSCKLAYRKFLFSSSDHLSQGWHDMFLDDYSLFAPVTTKENEQMARYFNRADVRAALHVTDTRDDESWPRPSVGFHYEKEYKACNWRGPIRFSNATMVDVYREILPELDRVWIYNGDTDPCVSYEGTREAVKRILVDELDGGSYRPWFYKQEAASMELLAEKAVLFGPDLVAQTLEKAQFAGEVTSYESGLSFVTFHGSGHMVPQFRPQASLRFLKRFLLLSSEEVEVEEGGELAPLLPKNATLAAMSGDDFARALDEWTEAARALAERADDA